MKKYYPPNETQVRSAVKGEDRYRFYERKRPALSAVWFILMTLLFFGLFALVFFFGLTGKE
jgi:hypothetical protein